MFAAKHINEDTATSFQGVARDFIAADQQLSARVSELNSASETLSKMIGKISSAQKVNTSDYQFHPPSVAGITSRHSVRSAANWWFISQLMSFCLGVGLLATAILVHYHLEGDAQRIGAFAAAIPLIIWIAKGFGGTSTSPKSAKLGNRSPNRFWPSLRIIPCASCFDNRSNEVIDFLACGIIDAN